MKKLMNNYRLLAVAAAVMVSTSFATVAQASGGTNKAPFELKWIGNQDESPVFKLALNNATAGEYSIVIKDENNQVLYAEKLKGSNLTRMYQLQNQGTEDMDAKITFEVTDRSTNTTVVYKVSTLVQLQTTTDVTIKQ
jgi:hypothetical protein